MIETRAFEFVPVGRADWARLPAVLGSGIDAVVHAAWDLKTPILQRPEDVAEANLMTTMRLLEACRTHGVPKFAYVSTCAVYGASMNTAEDADCCPVSINGIAKLLNERIIEAFCADAGIECQIYRVFNTFGGRDRFSILSHLGRALDHDRPFALNNGGVAQRDFIHVSDVARVITTLLPMHLPATHVNVGTGRATRVADIVAVVQRMHPKLRMVARSVDEAEYSRADITRLSSVLGREMRFVDVVEFVEDAFRPDPSARVSTRR